MSLLRSSRLIVLGGSCLVTVALAAPAASAQPFGPLPAATRSHAYRHGLVPMRGRQARASQQASSGPNNLAFGGDIAGVGVTTGAPRVYLVFWGSQWGTQGSNGQGDVTLSGDPSGMAPYLEAFLKGLGTGGETWSGVMTQYCDGVSAGTETCPSSNTEHVGYPSGGAYAGLLVDERSAAPAQATGNQIGAEAVYAAGQFGNTTAASQRNVQYVIVSPTGTDPDMWLEQGFCAWHDYTGDSTLSGGAVNSPYGQLAFTNLPYLTDAGAGCGQNFVNAGSAGNLDGASIVEGHEYAETITDQFPAGGWTVQNIFSFFYGYETGDLCAWDSNGPDPSQNITLTTGTFAVQPTWANDYSGGAGGCLISHSIVTDGGSSNTVTVTPVSNQTSTQGQVITPLQMSAQDSATGQTFTWSATGLPNGLSISSSGAISGTPTGTGTSSVTVTAKDTTGATGSTSFSWTVNPGPFNFSLSASPTSASVKHGTSAKFTISTTLTSGSAQSVSLSAAGNPALPAGSWSFSPSSVTAGGKSTLTISTSSLNITTYTITITGSGGGASHQITVSLTVRKH